MLSCNLCEGKNSLLQAVHGLGPEKLEYIVYAKNNIASLKTGTFYFTSIILVNLSSTSLEQENGLLNHAVINLHNPVVFNAPHFTLFSPL
ncbi:hypothetical protein L1887_40002 [Cichorium endivia]|nr:hypothetical protein L1887_40002 [Cichorium endivia]